MYKFTPVKSNGTDIEEFTSALDCARISVESILFDYNFIVKVINDEAILVLSQGGLPMSIRLF